MIGSTVVNSSPARKQATGRKVTFVKPQPARSNAVAKPSLAEEHATGKANTFVKIGHGRWRGRHDQGGDSAKVVDFARNVGEYESDSDYSPADEFEGLDDCEPSQPVHPSASQSVNPDNVPRSIHCQKPFGNVIIQDGPMREPSRGGGKQYQSPPRSVARVSSVSPDVQSPLPSEMTAI